jgi:hypothetical protein
LAASDKIAVEALSLLIDSEAPPAAEETEDISIVKFEPGRKMDIEADWKTGEVLYVVPAGQGAMLGVQDGWQFYTLNDEAYSEALMDSCIAGGQPYTVCFLHIAASKKSHRRGDESPTILV